MAVVPLVVRYARDVVHVRATAIIARVNWVLTEHGSEGLDRVLASMDPALAAEIKGTVVPGAWVSFPAFVALGERIDAIWGNGDLALCRTLGAYAANFNLKTIYRIFYMIGSLRFILSKASQLWSEQYDSGEAAIVDVEGGVSLLVKSFATPHAVHCLSVLGWMEQSAKISGADVIDTTEVRCRTRGDDVCEFRLRYR
jgi:hypothetical protein